MPTFNRQKAMSKGIFSSSRTFLLGSAMAVVILVPAFAADAETLTSEPCVIADSSSSTVVAGAGSGSTTVITGSKADTGPVESCQSERCASASTVTTGSGRLSSTTSVPGGTSITVQSGNGTSSSTVVSAGGSGRSGASSTVAATASGGDRRHDCVVVVNPGPQKNPDAGERQNSERD